jgi:hypothetical protein
MTDTPLWERQPTDTDKSYAAFCVYRDMGAQRSLEKLRQNLGKSKALMEQWSKAHKWVDRATAYDTHLQSKHSERVAQVQIEVIDNAIGDYRAIRKAIAKRLQVLEMVDYTAPAADLHELISLMQRADFYARLAVGLPEKITESKNTNDNKHSGTVTLLSDLSDDDLDSIINS